MVQSLLLYLYDYDSLGRLIRQEIKSSTDNAHIGRVEFGYDIRNNLTKVATEFSGYTVVDEYLYSENSGNVNAATYAKDNLISRYKINGSATNYVDYTYDSLNRLDEKSLNIGNKKIVSDYIYYTSVKHNQGLTNKKYKTTQVATEKLDTSAYLYYYDEVGNITEIKTAPSDNLTSKSEYRSYTYDKKNQLLRENNKSSNETVVYTYDGLGNISTKTKYAYTTSDSLGTSNETITYNYGKDSNAGWNHILTSVDLDDDSEISENEKIKYDAIGNPTKYLGASLSWLGRELTSYKKGSTQVVYTYNADGLRGAKIHNGTKSTYHYVGGQLRYEERGNRKFFYFYDASGNLSAIRYYNANGVSYDFFTLTNQQGDVISIYDSTGSLSAKYEYDAWGKVISVKNASGTDISTNENHIANLNPIRYRGYYYDTETGLYYLQSRYYDPQVGRFLNADGTLNGNGDVLGFNMFAYCGNNSVNNSDPSGQGWIKDLFRTVKKFFDQISIPIKTAKTMSGPVTRRMEHSKNVVNTIYNNTSNNASSGTAPVSESFEPYKLMESKTGVSYSEHIDIVINSDTIYSLTDITKGRSWEEIEQDGDEYKVFYSMICWDNAMYNNLRLYDEDDMVDTFGRILY